MVQERFYTWIGLFVAGAMFLVTFGAVFIYDQYLHAKVETYVMFFKGSLNGLDASSIVTYRGIKIGKVRLIEVTENKTRTNVDIPVYVEFFVEKSFGKHVNPIRLLIDNGMVANITSPNLLTGTASIELVKADPIVKYVANYYRGYPIFPTKRNIAKPSSIDNTLQTARRTLKDISKLVRSREVKETLAAAKAMADSLDRLSSSLDRQLPSALSYLNESLKQFSKTAYSARSFIDYLSRHPEALLRGKN